ncbi:hypothetical protein HUO09_07925 [Vibrio sp. Y2-5]|nr:hypothetical protein [Vibrio sp. Y2-5]NIY92111.1 hypothetical protein [Vibrio diazotrophicus]
MLVNPSRRGLGNSLTDQQEAFTPKYIVYSSCNPHTMNEDVKNLPSYKVVKVQWFDMFPPTNHAEVLAL